MKNRRFYRVALAVGTALAGVGCADTSAPVARNEDMLASTGFVAKKADNTVRMAALKRCRRISSW